MGAEPPPQSTDGSTDPSPAWASIWIPPLVHPSATPRQPKAGAVNHRYLHALRPGVLGDRAEREARPYLKLDLFSQAH